MRETQREEGDTVLTNAYSSLLVFDPRNQISNDSCYDELWLSIVSNVIESNFCRACSRTFFLLMKSC